MSGAKKNRMAGIVGCFGMIAFVAGIIVFLKKGC